MRRKADWIDAVSTGYAGMRSKSGFGAMRRMLELLRKG